MVKLNFKIPRNDREMISNFKDKYDGEILTEIAKQEEIARDLYTRILEKTDYKLFEGLTRTEDATFFYQILKQMVNDEKRHIEMMKKNPSQNYKNQVDMYNNIAESSLTIFLRDFCCLNAFEYNHEYLGSCIY
jgi:hypothetical protein